jgi:F0F1-type ATP synthase assembly protein I
MKKPLPRPSSDYLRYSGLAFQLIALILIGVWLGGKIDAWQQSEQPIWTAIFSLLFVCAGMYQLFRELSKKSD